MLLIIGSTGTLGQALRRAATVRGMQARGAARNGAEHKLDIADREAITSLCRSERPQLVINCAAITDLDLCERQPAFAYLVNARGAGLVAAASAEVGARCVHVSTDHFFTGDGSMLHDEAAPVRLVNEYARSKYAGEALASAVPGSLVIRTNLTGWRGWSGRATFLEWAVGALERREIVTGFGDFFTSTLDADTLANAILDLVAAGATGFFNVAAREAVHKAAFLRQLSRALGLSAETVGDGSVRQLAPPRAESLGLDVRKAEAVLGYRLPGVKDVVAALVKTRPQLHRAS
jgi:dTDP-4-dehydrorhamnose reductase